MTDVQDDRPLDAERPFTKVAEDPTAFYDDLRERCPVALVGERTRYWALTRAEDITAAAMNPEVFASGLTPRLRIRSTPLESDPPEHMQIRRLLQGFFLPARMAAFEPVSRRLAAELLAPLLARGHGDAGAALAQPLPAQVLLSVIGQPVEDWRRIKTWAQESYLDRSSDPADRAVFQAADDALYAYCREIVADRKRAPRDPASDIPSALLAGQVDGAPFDEGLVVGALRLLVSAGHDSTTTAISICLHHLATHPEHQDRLRADPALIALAVEEILRLKAPVTSMPRTLTRDHELGGRTMRAGDRVRLVFASGNRDPRAFPEPATCVLDRKPNRHMVFGQGAHLCIGAPLARQEIRVLLEHLLAGTRSFALNGEPEREFWHPYGMHRLPLRFDAAA